MTYDVEAKIQASGWDVSPLGCWIWRRSKDKDGYGQAYVPKLRKAHRVAYELWVGPIPEGHGVLHHCDNPPCINPEHLFTGTPRVNNLDMIEKGRMKIEIGYGRTGILHPQHRLTEAEVIRIKYGGEVPLDLALEFNMTRENIYAIRKGRTWKHL